MNNHAGFRAARYDRWFDDEAGVWRMARVAEAYGDTRDDARLRCSPPTQADRDRRFIRIIVGPAGTKLPSVNQVFKDADTPAGRLRERMARDPNRLAPGTSSNGRAGA